MRKHALALGLDCVDRPWNKVVADGWYCFLKIEGCGHVICAEPAYRAASSRWSGFTNLVDAATSKDALTSGEIRIDTFVLAVLYSQARQ